MPTSSNEPANGGTSPGPIARPKRIRWGGIIFFKVEEIIFEAPRYRFAEQSEVFETMFQLPTGSDSGRVEGQDEEHPIVLEGYRAAHFDGLLKVLYPMADDVISGSFQLEKEGWIGTLNLATRWSMKKIRKLAISELSRVPLSPVEKVALGREHKVANWFRDGLTELVSARPIQPLSELKSRLGTEIVYTLLWIQNQTLQKAHETGLVLNGLSLAMLTCHHCRAGIFTSTQNCISCSRALTLDDRGTLYISSGMLNIYVWGEVPATAPAITTFHINLQYVMCRGCSKCALSLTDYTCPSCSSSFSYVGFKVDPSRNVVEDSSTSQKILEEFGDEIASYESWD